MSIRITGINKTKFLFMVKKALEESHGSPITKNHIVLKFIKTLFGLNNEHEIHTVFGMDAVDENDFKEIRPMILKGGVEGKSEHHEFSLEQIVKNHYERHFSSKESEEFTKLYFEDWNKRRITKHKHEV